MSAVPIYGWPSRVRGDFGKENNGVERCMIAKWGQRHRAYIRGRSTQNIRMERAWRDVRKATLDIFCEIFMYLEANDLLDMENPIHRIFLFVVFQPRIQKFLDETVASWNLHKVRPAHKYEKRYNTHFLLRATRCPYKKPIRPGSRDEMVLIRLGSARSASASHEMSVKAICELKEPVRLGSKSLKGLLRIWFNEEDTWLSR
ncbi:hypothetical protein B0H14DRAFT_2621490 [Mycena olivaceomarginata]|nr:hypothetical protein B0H14DRAFT_2621490 [Mycena olivaceomarginata]